MVIEPVILTPLNLYRSRLDMTAPAKLKLTLSVKLGYSMKPKLVKMSLPPGSNLSQTPQSHLLMRVLIRARLRLNRCVILALPNVLVIDHPTLVVSLLDGTDRLLRVLLLGRDPSSVWMSTGYLILGVGMI